MAGVNKQERLTSTYYDTPDGALRRRKLTLRVRERDGQYTQTVKEESPAQGILSRGEWEDAVDENRPDPTAAESGPHLPDIPAGDVRPVFVTEIRRTAFEIEPAPGTAIEASIDEGQIRALDDDRAESVVEIELELKRGDAALIYDIALRLLEVAPLRIETRSKSERGYHLIGGGDDAPPAIHAEPIELHPEMTAEAALGAIGRTCLAQLLRNEPAVLTGSPEGVHQMRVAVRRLRSAIPSFKKFLPQDDVRWVAEELRWLGRALGPARNLDIFATELLPGARCVLPDHPGWDSLSTDLDWLRRGAHEKGKEAVLSQRYTQAMLRLLRWFDGRGWRRGSSSDEPGSLSCPIIGSVSSVLDRRMRNVRHRSKDFKLLPPPKRHKLRIAVKKLRYTMELFGSLFGLHDLAAFAGRLKHLQTDLGYVNDVRVAHEYITELFAEIEPRSLSALAWVALLETHDQHIAAGERKLRRHLRQLVDTTPFWRR
jgi:inorganic triphosphatase YgiF